MPITKYALENSASLGILPDRFEHLEKKLDDWVSDGSSQGITIRVARSGAEVFNGAYGLSSPGGKALAGDAIFPVASITKPVVAVLLLQLQEDGEIDICCPVEHYLPEFGKGDICVYHLLTHTSGLDEDTFFDDVTKYASENYGLTLPEDADWPEREKFHQALCDKIGLTGDGLDTEEKLWYHLPAKHKPGTVMSYNNFGYDTALRIARRITGERPDELARRKIFGPLGMIDSHFILPEEKYPRLVQRGEGFLGYPWQNDCHDWDSGSGGLKTTTADMQKFMEMIRLGGRAENGDRVLSHLSVRLMSENQNSHLDNFSAWTLGLNYHGTKFDDTGMMRSAGALDHGGAMACCVQTDAVNKITFTYFSIMRNKSPLRRALVSNIIMSAIDG